MKKFIIIFFAFLFALTSCHFKNFDNDFPDYEGGTSAYFPYQFPVRTIVLGDYVFDNSNDLEHKFVISAGMGGVYENKVDRKFTVTVDETLCNDNIRFSSGGDIIRPLPSNYYSLSSTELVIPKGKMNGGIVVQLTDAFFNDPDAIKRTYVVPLRLSNPNNAVDRMLTGTPLGSVQNADPRIVSQWSVAPKDFTMFGVKYVNEYYGTYLYYGSSILKDKKGNVIEENQYKTRYVELNDLVDFFTTGRYQAVSRPLFFRANLPKSYRLVLDFDKNNKCVVSGTEIYTREIDNPDFDSTQKEDPITNPKKITVTTTYVVSGTGDFVTEKAGSYAGWSDKDRNVINVKYTVNVDSDDPEFNTDWVYSAEEHFAIRNRDIQVEVYSPRL